MRGSIEGDLNKSPAGDKSLGVVMKKTDDPTLPTVDKRATPVTDLGGTKPTKSTVAESEVRYRRLFETAKDGILILDADTGMITEANPYLQAILGYSHAELLGRALWAIGPFK